MTGATREDASKMGVGDVIAVAKLKGTITNDVLCDKSDQVKLVPISFPSPVYRAAIRAKKRGDEDKMGAGLHKLGSMDPTFITRNEANIGQITVNGMGELHLMTMLARLKEMSGVEAELFKPRIAYQETITKKANGAYKHRKQSGGRGQYGHVLMRMGAKPRGEGFEFINSIVGGTIPSSYIPAVEKGIHDYSFSEISQIVESNDAKLLGAFISKMDGELAQITVKIGSTMLNEVIQTFRRYSYNIVSGHEDDSFVESLKERSNYLNKYLNI
jgi:elongation factor G